MSKHTPSPWYRSRDCIVQTDHITRDVRQIPHCEEDLDFIVEACNSHEALVAALSALLDEQNGPPLLARQKQWSAATTQAMAALKLAGVQR